MEPSQQDVIVAGAGPTGLALSAELKRLGISSLLLDRLEAVKHTSRAVAVHARTLEVLEPLGVTPELIENGIELPVFHVRDRSHVLASIDFHELKTKYPFTLVCPQDRTEAILLKKLEGLGGGVHRPCEVVGISQNDGHVELKYKNSDGEQTVRGKWLAGCDGMHSVVREQAGIDYEGGEYEERFMLADVEMDWPLGRDAANLFFSEQGLMVVIPLPETKFRVVATIQQEMPEPTIEDVQKILGERGPADWKPGIRQIIWGSQFHIYHHVAKTMRQGRILLAGDAAHVHSPAGGQGMNTGIQEAVSLAGVLKTAIQKGDEKPLNDWQEDRLKIAHSIVSFTDRLTKVATASSKTARTLRNFAIEMMGHIPMIEHQLAEKLSELDNR